MKEAYKRNIDDVMIIVSGLKVDTMQSGSTTDIRRYLKGISREGVHGRSGNPRSGRKEVKEKRSEEDRARQVQWRGVYRSVSLIVDLGHQGSYGFFGTRLGIRDTEAPQR